MNKKIIMYIKMNKKIRAFWDTEFEKHKVNCHENQHLIDDVDINEIIVSNEVSFSKKGFKRLQR